MEFNAGSDIAVYIIAGIVYLVLVIMIYFFIQSKSRKIAQKMLKEALESEGYGLGVSSAHRKKVKIEKKVVDEIIFFIGFGISIVGLAAKNYNFLLIGVIISIFSVFLLHLMLRNEEHSLVSAVLNEEEKKVLRKKLSQKNITIIKGARGKSEPEHDASDIAKFLHIVDEMLEKIPEEDISRFAVSDEFGIYRRVMKEPPRSVNDDLRKLAPLIDKMLGNPKLIRNCKS